jgi:hypothetical protein
MECWRERRVAQDEDYPIPAENPRCAALRRLRRRIASAVKSKNAPGSNTEGVFCFFGAVAFTDRRENLSHPFEVITHQQEAAQLSRNRDAH